MPVIQPIIAERGLGGAPQPTVQRDGSIGRAVQGLGNALENAAQAQQALNLRQQKMDMQVRDFRADQNFRQFQEGLGSSLDEAQSKMDPSGQGLTTGFAQQFDKKSADFLATVPEALKPKFSELIQTSRAGWVDKVAHAEREQRYSWFRTGISDSQEKLQAQVFNDPSVYDAAKADGLRAIEASGLPDAEKEELRKKWDETLALTIGERDVRDAQNNPALAKDAAKRYGVSGVTTENGGDAMSLVRGHEGFRPTPYWDVNAYRIGYGSDTITTADGKKVKVTQGMKITRADAERDLARRVKEFEVTARDQVGDRAWGALPANAQAALVSVAYNYGRLPSSVANAIKSGNVNAVADAVENLDANKGRRREEAAVIRGGAIASNAPDDADPRLASLSLSDRLKLYDRTMAAARQGQAEINAQRKTLQDQTYDDLRLGIETGDVVSEQSILSSPNIDNGQKATLLNTLRTRQSEDADVSAYIAAWSQGSEAAKINPFDSKEAALNNKAFDKIMKNAPDDQKQAITEQYVKSTGNIPNATVADVRQGLASSNVAEVADGMEKAARLYQVAPEAMDAVSNGKDLKDAALAYNEYVYGRGMTAQGAGQRWLDLHSPDAVEKRERLKKPAQDFLKTLSVSDVTSALDTHPSIPFVGTPSAGLTPDQQAAVMTDYSKIAEEKFLQTGGDADLAKKMALQDMTKLYGVSNVSGSGVVTKFPPEHYYPPIAGSQDYIRDAAMKDAKSVDVTALNVSLVPTKETADDIRLGQPPRYRLMFQREDGVWDAVPGQLFSVSPDEINSLMKADSKKRLDAAKAVHQQLLDEQAVSDKALNTTVGPDWMKARAAEAARERQKMDAGGAQMNQDNGKLGQEFLKGMSETIANPPPF